MIAQRDFERTVTHGDLPPAPRFCRTAQLTDLGIVLGEGIVLAPLARGGDGALVVERREAKIFALLSLAQGGAVRPNVLHGFHGVSKALARGEIVGAMIRLAQIGLRPLRGPRDAEMLKAGAVFLDKGFSPWAILQAAGIEEANVRLFKAEWSEDLHPRDASNGRFVSAGGAAAVPASVAQSLIAGGAMQVSAGVYALAGGALLSMTAAGWVLSHGPKGNIQDGPGYWLPGVSSDEASDGDGKGEAPGLGHNGGPALDQAGGQQSGDQNERDPDQKPDLSVVAAPSSSGSSDDGSAQQGGNNAQDSNGRGMSDILLPNGRPVGYISRGAGASIQTVTRMQFDDIQSRLLDGATSIASPSSYEGAWYLRSDGTVFGVRTSGESGATIDVIQSDNPALPSGFKVHQK